MSATRTRTLSAAKAMPTSREPSAEQPSQWDVRSRPGGDIRSPDHKMASTRLQQGLAYTNERPLDEIDDDAEAEEESQGEEDEDEDEGEDDYDEEDVEAKAEAVAKSLGDQLWADIGRAFGVQPTGSAPVPHLGGTENGATGAYSAFESHSRSPPLADTDSLVQSVTLVLHQAAADASLYDVLNGTEVPGYGNLLLVLKGIAESGEVQDDQAEILGRIIATIASGHSEPSRKRKREEDDDGGEERRRGPPASIQELKAHLFATISVISHALTSNLRSAGYPVQGGPAQTQSEQILAFAYACAHRAESDDIEIPELTALVWMLRALSGIRSLADGGLWSLPSAMSSDGNALYPCLHPNCNQTYRRLQALRMHQEQHTQDRPFRCRRCPASFARNHDLKRHNNSHEKKTFLCQGCSKVYTRRDAVKRHKDHPRCSNSCRTTPIVEILANDGYDYVDDSTPDPAYDDLPRPPSEFSQAVGSQAQAVVSQLYSLLQSSSVDAPPGPSSSYADIVSEHAVSSHYGLIPPPLPDAAATLSNFGLSAEHTQLLQRAIALTAEAARQQAEREAEDEEFSGEEDEEEGAEGNDEDEISNQSDGAEENEGGGRG